MTLRQPHEDAVLFSEEIPVIRQALAACSTLLAWAEKNGGPQFREAVAEAAGAAGPGRSPSGLAYDISLSIDYLDFAPAARSTR
jgi:hypothetical protein